MFMMNITKSNFEELVLKNPKTVLLDFWAPWCGPCRMVAPIVEEIAAQREDIAVGKINVDEEMELAVRFGIISIPTLVVMKGGELAQKAVGYMPKAEILKLLDWCNGKRERLGRSLELVEKALWAFPPVFCSLLRA